MQKKGKKTKSDSLKKEAKKIVAGNTKQNKSDFRGLIVVTFIFLIFLVVVLVYKGNFPVEKTVKTGDKITINYIGTFDSGKIFDSNIKDVLEKNNVEAKTRYLPSKFRIGAGQILKGVDDAVIGMKVGEEKTITLAPENAFGPYLQNKTLLIPLSKETQLYDKVSRDNIIRPKDLADVFNVTLIKVNDTLPASAKYKLPMRVISVGEKEITARMLPKAGDIFAEGAYNYTVVSVFETEMVVKRKPLSDILPSEFGQLILTETKNGIISTYNVSKKGEKVTVDGLSYYIIGERGNNILLDQNHPLAGKVLIFKVNVTSIEELEIKVK